MNSLAKIWDFIWGTLLVGMLPMFAFYWVGILGGLAQPLIEGNRLILLCFCAASLAVPSVTLYLVVRWRRKHRLLPASLLVVEILLGLLLAGTAFLFTLVFWGFASLD